MTTLDPRTTFQVSATPGWLAPSVGAGPESLPEAVMRTVSGVDGTMLQPVTRSDAGVTDPPRSLLALLVYCYARMTYGSAAIVAAFRRDANLRMFCQHDIPAARILRRFRRINREAIRRCLHAILRFLADQKVADGLVNTVKDEHLAEEARRRIIMAMFIDSMEAKDTDY